MGSDAENVTDRSSDVPSDHTVTVAASPALALG